MTFERQITKARDKGMNFLERIGRRGRFPTYWGIGSALLQTDLPNWNDNYTSILIRDCMFDDLLTNRSMVAFETEWYLFNLMRENPLIGFFHTKAAKKKWPTDGDDTGFCASVLLRAGSDYDGFTETCRYFWRNYDFKAENFKLYFGKTVQCRKKERSDPIATMNMVTFLGQVLYYCENLLVEFLTVSLAGHEIKNPIIFLECFAKKIEEFIGHLGKLQKCLKKTLLLLKEEKYLEKGFSFYYHNATLFLYFLGRMAYLLELDTKEFNKSIFIKQVKKCVSLSLGSSLDLAMGITLLGRFSKADMGWVNLLLSQQDTREGNWPMSSLFRLGRTEINSEAARIFRYSGSEAASTALAVQACNVALKQLKKDL